MKILPKYILKEMIGPFLAGFLLFTFIFLSDKMTELADLIINYGVDFLTTIRLFIYLMPAFLAITMPMGVLVGVMVSFNRLNADNEIIAMKLSGLHIRSLIAPVLFASFTLSLLMVGWNNYVLPWGNTSFRNMVYTITRDHASMVIQKKIFISDFDKFVFYVEDKDDKTGFLKNIMVFTQETENEQAYYISAATGYVFPDPREKTVYLKLDNGYLHQVNSKNRTIYSKIKFSNYSIILDLKSRLTGMVSNEKSAREMNLKELGKEISKTFDKGINTNVLKVEYHKKMAIPFACLAFSIIGIALGISIKIKGHSLSFIISLGLILVYYFLLLGGEITGSNGTIAPWLSMWLPNIVTALIGLSIMYLAVKEKVSL